MLKSVSLAVAVATIALTASAYSQTPPDLRAHAHRVASADQMIERLNTKIARSHIGCVSTECTAAIQRVTSLLPTIREVAERDNPVAWTKLVDDVHKFEREIDGPLYWAEHNR